MYQVDHLKKILFFFKHTYTLIDQTSLRVLAHRVVIANELTLKYQCPPVTSFACRQKQTLQLAKHLCLNLRDTEIKFSKTFNILQLNRLLVNKMIHINQARTCPRKRNLIFFSALNSNFTFHYFLMLILILSLKYLNVYT